MMKLLNHSKEPLEIMSLCMEQKRLSNGKLRMKGFLGNILLKQMLKQGLWKNNKPLLEEPLIL